MTEESLIDALLERVPHEPLPLGPGDDAAVLEPSPGSGRRVITTDTYVEGVHFLRAHPPAWLAEKLLVANLADVSAMGATPEAFTLSVSLPQETPRDWWFAFCEGLGSASRAAGVVVVGGDVTASPETVMFSMTAWGALAGNTHLARSGGEAGDLVMVMGVPGLSRAGWERWSSGSPSGWGSAPLDTRDPALLAHLRPRPDLMAGRWALSEGAHAAMDLSDGLARDGQRLAVASGVDLVVDVDRLPPLPEAVELDVEGRLAGGEEHELLALVPARSREAFEARGFTTVGVAHVPTGEPTIRWERSGRPFALEPRPFEHF